MREFAYSKHHFYGLEIWKDLTCIVRPTCRTHIGHVQKWDSCVPNRFEAIFQVSSSIATPDCAADMDVLGGAEDAEPILRKDPATWLRVCRNRAVALAKRHATQDDQPPNTFAELVRQGLSREQAACYVESHAKAKGRQTWHRKWDASMPPMVRQTFGVTGSMRKGVRIPLPNASVSLPAQMPQEHDITPSFTWLARCHSHERDTHIEFVSDGHRYFVHGQAVEMSVTSFLATFSEDGRAVVTYILSCVYVGVMKFLV